MKNFSIKTKNIKIMIENDNSFHAGNYDITSGRNVKKFKKVDEYFMILSPFVHDCIFDQDQSSDYIWKIPSNIPSTVIRIKGNEIWIHSSLYRHQDLFFIFIQSEIFITTDLSEALKNKENSINVRYCQNFILSSEKFNEETAFSGIFRIPMGTIFHWDGQNYTLSSSLTVNKKYTKSLSEFSHYYKQAISSNLKLIVHHYGMPKLMFSGGLDSSFLADCLKKNLLPFDAFHVCTPSNLGEGETDIANLHASDLSINLHFVQADESSGSRKNPSPIIPLSPCDIEVLPLIFWEESSNPNFFDKRVVINGHGGDATFFSSGDPKLPFELLKSGRIKDAWETLNSYCNVSGLTYGQCIIRAFSSNLSYQTKRYKHVCQWMNILPDSRDNVHPMLHNIRGSDKTYISGVLDMIFSNLPFDPRPKYQTFHPLAFPNIINLALLMDRSQFFKQDLDRFCYRYAAMTSTKSSYPSRLPKREASAIMFLALNTIFQELDEELSKDKFLHNIGISVEKIREILRYNSTINLTPDFPSIIRAISIMKYLRTWVKV